jgi:hypothetical protein
MTPENSSKILIAVMNKTIKQGGCKTATALQDKERKELIQ